MQTQTQVQKSESQTFFLVEIFEECEISVIKKSSNRDELEKEAEKLREEAKRKFGRYAVYVEYKVMTKEEFEKLEKYCKDFEEDEDVDVDEEDENDDWWWEEVDEWSENREYETDDENNDSFDPLDEQWARAVSRFGI